MDFGDMLEKRDTVFINTLILLKIQQNPKILAWDQILTLSGGPLGQG